MVYPEEVSYLGIRKQPVSLTEDKKKIVFTFLRYHIQPWVLNGIFIRTVH